MKTKNKTLTERVKTWWEMWSFVILFSIAILIALVGWKVLVGLFFTEHWLGIPLSILFLFASIIFFISLVLAIAEKNKYTVSMILLLFGTSIAITGYYITNQSLEFSWDKVASDFYANISAEMISIVITVLVIDSLGTRFGWRDYVRNSAEQIAEETIQNSEFETPKIEAPAPTPPQQNGFEMGIFLATLFALVGIGLGYFLGRRE